MSMSRYVDTAPAMCYCPDMSTSDSDRDRRWTIRSGADLGRAISGVRVERGLTQADLARETGVNRSYLAELESGAEPPLVIERALRALRRMGATVTISLPVEGDRGERD